MQEKEKCKISDCKGVAKTRGYCQYHYWKSIREKSKKIGCTIKKGQYISKSQVNKISKKYSEGLKLYKKARQEYLELHRCCEAKLTGCLAPTIVCDIKLLQIHHKIGRQGEKLYDSKYFMTVCQSCHNYLTENPEFAIENGFSISRLKKQE